MLQRVRELLAVDEADSPLAAAEDGSAIEKRHRCSLSGRRCLNGDLAKTTCSLNGLCLSY